ncbi:MAG: urease accessory protein UreF [Pseudomonadota bacterium]
MSIDAIVAPADVSLLRLMQLVSPALPVGAYAYSQGLEHAVCAGWVRDEATAAEWIGGLLDHALCRLDVPVLSRLHAAWMAEDCEQVEYWAAFLHASRESAELQAEDRHLGGALARLLTDLEFSEARPWIDHPCRGFAVLFALAGVRWGIAVKETLAGYLWTWAENQVAAAIKLVPLGQTAGQRILSRMIKRIPSAVERASGFGDEDIGFFTPGLGIASAAHETQYSRLFRS